MLNGTDVAIVQHEYGLYDGADGDAVVDVLDGLAVPSIVVAHTVVARADRAPARACSKQVVRDRRTRSSS